MPWSHSVTLKVKVMDNISPFAFKDNDLEFQGQMIEIKNSNYHLWIPWPRNYTHEKFHEEIRSGRPKSSWVATPPLAANVNWNSLAVRGLKIPFIWNTHCAIRTCHDVTSSHTSCDMNIFEEFTPPRKFWKFMARNSNDERAIYLVRITIKPRMSQINFRSRILVFVSYGISLLLFKILPYMCFEVNEHNHALTVISLLLTFIRN